MGEKKQKRKKKGKRASRRNWRVVIFHGTIDARNEGLFVDGIKGTIHAARAAPRTALKRVMARSTHAAPSSTSSSRTSTATAAAAEIS